MEIGANPLPEATVSTGLTQGPARMLPTAFERTEHGRFSALGLESEAEAWGGPLRTRTEMGHREDTYLAVGLSLP